MANPNLVRKAALAANTTGEVSQADILNTNLISQNYIINGDMRVSQRGNSFATPTSGQYMLDRWAYSQSTSATHTVTVDTDVPTTVQSDYMHQSSMRFNLTAADNSIGAGENNGFFQRIEGYNWAQFASKPFTLSFWVKASLAGTYCCYFLNQGENRSYIAEYTINSSATWEYKTISVPVAPTTGSWNYNTGIGLTVGWTLATGSSLQTPAGSWTTGSFRGSANQINGIATGAVDFRITGVMINQGTVAAPFAKFGRTWDGEYAACQRYYEITPVHAMSDASNGAIVNITGPFCAAKRAIPVCSSIGVIAHINGGGGSFTFVGVNSSSPNGLYCVINNGSPLTNNQHFRGIAEANSEL